MTHEVNSTFETPYLQFPADPEIIKIGGQSVYEYISPEGMKEYIKNLSDQVDLTQFEKVLVNMNGGKFLFKQMSHLQGYEEDPVLIEYHRPEEAYGAIVVIPVPSEFKNKKVLVIDDIYDSGGVLRAIMEKVDPSSQAIALVTKNGIPNQIKIPNILIGLKIDKKWVGGCGMDMGFPGEENNFRNYPGLAVKIQDP